MCFIFSIISGFYGSYSNMEYEAHIWGGKKTVQFYPEAQTEQICNLFDVNLIIYIAKK